MKYLFPQDIWTARLPEKMRTAIANQSLGGGNMQNVLKLADAVYRASLPSGTGTTVAATTVKAAENTETASTLPIEAFQRDRGRGRGRFGRSATGRRGQSKRGRGPSKAKKDQKKATHPYNRPASCCKQHQRFWKTSSKPPNNMHNRIKLQWKSKRRCRFQKGVEISQTDSQL